MYEYLGVEHHAQPFLFNFSKVAVQDIGPTQTMKWPSYFIHSSNHHRIPPMRPEGIRTTAWLLEILYLLLCYTWFSACCFFIRPRPADEKAVCETLDDYLHRIRLPQYFVTYYLLPVMSSVTTCSHKALLDFPAADVTEYKRRTHGKQHYTVSNGVQDVQEKLSRGIDTRLSVMVSAVETQPSGVKLSLRERQDPHGLAVVEEVFDRVILAVSPDVVGKVFRPLRYEMAQIPVASVDSIIHTDKNRVGGRLVRLDGQNRATRNSHLHHNAAHTVHLRTSTDGLHCTESIHVQPSGALVTTCPFSYIDPVQVIKSSKFTRVLRTPESRRIINNIFGDRDLVEGIDGEKRKSGWKNGNGRVWLVGGWCWDGLVLLEGCVSSAMNVADAFNVQVPWRASSF